MKQETLEEYQEALKQFPESDQYSERIGFEGGAKWQKERSYIDMQEYADYCLMCSAEKTLKIPVPPKDWFEQFKKKSV